MKTKNVGKGSIKWLVGYALGALIVIVFTSCVFVWGKESHQDAMITLLQIGIGYVLGKNSGKDK